MCYNVNEPLLIQDRKLRLTAAAPRDGSGNRFSISKGELVKMSALIKSISKGSLSNFGPAIKQLSEAYRKLLDIGDLYGSYELIFNAFQLNPTSSAIAKALVNHCLMIGELEQAQKTCDKILALQPELVLFCHKKAQILAMSGDIQKSIKETMDILKRLEYSPRLFFLAMKDIADNYALLGDYGQSNNWMTKIHNYVHGRRGAPCNQEILGCSAGVLVIAGRGLGDSIQNLRFVQHLEGNGVPICLRVDEKLHELIRLSGVSAKLYPRKTQGQLKKNQVVPDVPKINLRSLRAALNLDPNAIKASKAYIAYDYRKRSKWEKLLNKQLDEFIVGINWSGDNAVNMKGSLHQRSLRLDMFYPLSRIAGIRLLSLQKGCGSEQLISCGFAEKFVAC